MLQHENVYKCWVKLSHSDLYPVVDIVGQFANRQKIWFKCSDKYRDRGKGVDFYCEREKRKGFILVLKQKSVIEKRS